MDKIREKTDQKLQKIEKKIQDNPRKTAITLLTLTILTATTTALLTLPAADNIIQKKNLSEDLVLHYNFDSGNTEKVIDRSGNNHTGKMHKTPVFTEGKEGLALEFDNTSYLETNSTEKLREEKFTITAWIRPDTLSGRGWIIANAYLGEKRGFFMERYGEEARFYIGTNNSEIRIKGGKIEEKQWNHIATSVDTNEVTLYVDGKIVAQKSISKNITHSKRDFIVADDTWSPGSAGGRKYKGKIDGIRIYRDSLTPKEVKLLSRSKESGFVVSTPVSPTLLLLVLIAVSSAYIQQRRVK